MNQEARQYPSDLTNQQWEIIKVYVPAARVGGRKRTTDVRRVIDAILYLIRTGCAWRYLPKEYPPWPTIYDYFCRWRDDGTWLKIHRALAQKVRVNKGRSDSPNLVIIDGQSVKAQYGEERGWDGFKKVRGRKRQILVDSLGIIWAAKVHRANQQESTRGDEVIKNYPLDIKQPSVLLGDSGYDKSPFDGRVYGYWGIWPEAIKGSKPMVRNKAGYLRATITVSNLKPQRWIVERSFAWFNHTRRLARDYERKVINSEVLLYLSQMSLLLNRLAPDTG